MHNVSGLKECQFTFMEQRTYGRYIIGASVSEPHTSESNGRFSLYIYIYVYIYASYVVRRSVYF